jgi:hypothetical protein
MSSVGKEGTKPVVINMHRKPKQKNERKRERKNKGMASEVPKSAPVSKKFVEKANTTALAMETTTNTGGTGATGTFNKVPRSTNYVNNKTDFIYINSSFIAETIYADPYDAIYGVTSNNINNLYGTIQLYDTNGTLVNRP